jgi:formate/nitrite transporter FocA (FNT family)
VIKTLIKAILAGMFIALGGVIYLAVENHYIGSLLFATGLYSVLVFELSLYTGKACNLTEIGISYALELAVILAGNLIGTLAVGFAVQYTRTFAKFTALEGSVKAKLEDTPLSIFILAVLCGIVMYPAVTLYKKSGSPIGVFVCVPLFILTGMEHCIANMFYFTAANAWSLHAAVLMLIMIAGNAVGCNLIPLCLKLTNKK